MRKTLALALLIAVTGRADAAPPIMALNLTAILRLESDMLLPAGAKTMSYYARFYALAGHDAKHLVRQGHDGIWGTFEIASGNTPPGVTILPFDRMPVISDGGCNVINLYFDFKAQKITHIDCNGRA